jgi:hypothetical protein
MRRSKILKKENSKLIFRIQKMNLTKAKAKEMIKKSLN